MDPSEALMKRSLIFSLLLAITSMSSIKADEVETVTGNIRECRMRYTPGFGPAETIDGYCVGKMQFADTYSEKTSSVAKKYLKKKAELRYIARSNSVGCNLIVAVAHPIECSIKTIYKNIELVVDGQNVLREIE